MMRRQTRTGRPGATVREGDATRFEVWAPDHAHIDLHIVAPADRLVAMERDPRGYHTATVADAGPGTRYLFRLPDGADLPDPASLSQPDGVHGPSEVVEPAFGWTDGDWRGIPQTAYTIYELHVGTFTDEGTFEAVIPHLAHLKELGITAIELLPVAEFPGRRNWGYDGVYPYAAQSSYGGIRGLQQLVDACHAHGLAVVLDVVHNHLGPEGNYTARFGPYVTDRYHTGWGAALNYDGPGSDEVRRFFIESALFWVTECHIDALRCDATHAIIDNSAYRFSAELTDRLHDRAARLERTIVVMAENDLNDPATVAPTSQNGQGYDAHWCDEYHHALHALLTGETNGYYEDFGRVAQFARAYRQGYVYAGDYSPHRQRHHGRAPEGIAPTQLVVFSQNHDQVGNRAQGERLSALVPFRALGLAAAATVLAPYLPLLFMGEEYGETAPFQYFVDHSDAALRNAVRKGRRAEFRSFGWTGGVPDPTDPATFERSRLNRSLLQQAPHRNLRDLYAELFRLRRELPALAPSTVGETEVWCDEARRVVLARRRSANDEALICFNFRDETYTLDGSHEYARPDAPDVTLNTGDARWHATDTDVAEPANPTRNTPPGDTVVPPLGALLLYWKELR